MNHTLLNNTFFQLYGSNGEGEDEEAEEEMGEENIYHPDYVDPFTEVHFEDAMLHRDFNSVSFEEVELEDLVSEVEAEGVNDDV